MVVKFWGVRGSIPTPLSSREIFNKVKKIFILSKNVKLDTEEEIENFFNNLPLSIKYTYGGNTPCISIETEKSFIILDMGSGARNLGEYILTLNRFKNGGELHIFFSHTHWDHIQGLPFFNLLYDKRFKLIFYSPFEDIEERLRAQQRFEFFPVKFDDTPSLKEFIILKEKNFIKLNNEIEVYWNTLIHPGGSFSYKFVKNSKSVVYATDTEFYKIDQKFMDAIVKSWNGADVLIFDAQYTPEEYIKKINWGHSSTLIAVDVALSANVKKLILFHYDPIYNDDFIENSLRRAKEYLETINGTQNLEILLSYEGLTIEI